MKLRILFTCIVLTLFISANVNLNADNKKAKKETTTEAPAKETKKAETKKVEEKKEASAGQCEATTKKGTQCTRKAKEGKFCKQHSK